MKTSAVGKIIFAFGIVTMFMYTTFTFLWALAGLALPFPLSVDNESFSLFQLLTPPLGAILMIAGGLIFGKKEKEVAL
ncbi:MAG: hypothetical protein ABH835_04370 [Patescibacteria group bacterium]|nr:hypothetical protein [Patescibacteria group bacterium]